MIDIGVLKKLFEALKPMEEIELMVDKNLEKLWGFEQSKTGTYGCKVEIYKNILEDVKWKAGEAVRFDVSIMRRVLKPMPSKEKFKITIDREIKMESLGVKKRFVKLSLLPPRRVEMINPDEQLSKMLKVNCRVLLDELLDNLEQSKVFGDHVLFQYVDGDICIGTSGDLGTTLMSFLTGIGVADVVSEFSIRLLMDIVKALKKISKEAIVGLGTDSPMRIITSAEGLTVNYYIAPRLREQK